MAAACVSLSGLVPALAEPLPAGHSSRIGGVHDFGGETISFLSADCDDDCGWVTHATDILGSGGHEINVSDADNHGVSVIARLDATWQKTVGTGGDLDAYANAFANTVAKSPGVHVWIVGNEPNVTLGTDYAQPYAAAYAAVRDRVHSQSGHADDVVLASPPSPWSPCFLDGFADIIDAIESRGVTIDGFSIHAGTGHTSSTQDAARITMTDTRQVCPGGDYPNSYGEFLVYRDYIRVIEDAGYTGAPVYITEFAHNCEGSLNCYADEDRGFFRAAYDEIDSWNSSASTLVRALTPYRWYGFGDGTSRDFAIGNKPNLLGDLAGGLDRQWMIPDDPGDGGGEDECPAPPCDLGGGGDDPGPDEDPIYGQPDLVGGCAAGGSRTGGLGGSLLALALFGIARRRRISG